jgi:hypothetical protein
VRSGLPIQTAEPTGAPLRGVHPLKQPVIIFGAMHPELAVPFGRMHGDYKDLFKSLEGSVQDYTSGALDSYDKEDVAGLLEDRVAKADGRSVRESTASWCARPADGPFP